MRMDSSRGQRSCSWTDRLLPTPSGTCWPGERRRSTGWIDPRASLETEEREMKVSVDLSKCHGHARCWATAPDLFGLDEDGQSSIGRDMVVPAGAEERATAAVLSCPEDA